MFDFDREYELATHPRDTSDLAAIELSASHHRKSATAHQQSGHSVDEVRVRGVIINPTSRQFVALVNNRVTPGCLTVMLPGGSVQPGNGELTTLAQGIRDELGITVQLGPDNCRFLTSRTYEFPDAQGTKSCRLNFYVVISDGDVPRNMNPDSVLSVSWMSLGDLHRFLALDGGNWKIQLGALDAVEAALDPAKAKVVDGKAREVARQDGGSPPSDEKYSKPTRMPYGGE